MILGTLGFVFSARRDGPKTAVSNLKLTPLHREQGHYQCIWCFPNLLRNQHPLKQVSLRHIMDRQHSSLFAHDGRGDVWPCL